MVNVILCDDNQQVLNYYQSVLLDTAAANGIEIRVRCYNSGEQLLFHLSENPNSADIIYLDILMGRMNGMETARKLREIGCFSQIIYLTTSNEYVFQAFDVEPYYYIVKEEMPLKKFKDIFLKVVNTVGKKAEDFITVSSGTTTTKVLLDKVYYFEIHNRQVTLHSTDGDIDFYSTLEELEQRLSDKDFIRIHRSYLINCHHISKLLRTQVTLGDGTELPVSNKYSQNVQTKFSKYLLAL